MKKILLFSVPGILVVALILLFVLHPASEKKRALAFYCPASEEQLYRELAAQYAAEQTEAEIHVIPVEGQEYDPAELLRSKKADMVAVTEKTIRSLQEKDKLLADLGEVAEGAGLIFSGTGDRLSVLPLTLDVPVLLCNETLLAEAQLYPPESPEGIAAVCAAIAEKAQYPFLLSLDADGRWEGEAIADGLLTDSPSGNTRRQEDGSLNYGFFDLWSLAAKLKPYLPEKEMAPKSREALMECFAEGAVALLPAKLSELTALPPTQFQWRAVPIFGGGIDHVLACRLHRGVAVRKGAAAKETATAFAGFLVSAEAQQLICEKQYGMPAIPGLQTDERWSDAYRLLCDRESENGRASFFSRLTEEEENACAEVIDSVFSQSEQEDFGLIEQKLEKEFR